MRILTIFSLASFLLIAGLTSASQSALAADGMVVKQSQHSVGKTLDQLTNILKKKGITVFARVDHKAGGKKVGKKLGATQVLIFGNPKMGTPPIQSARTISIDLPMKALAWKDADGKVWIDYNDSAYLALRHNIKDKHKIFKKMSGALKKLTSKVAN
jgi:uncharacterized protein (DUF302 family)